jgi:PTS system fructose-specific IIA component/PTS system nitrogen regulatory IIA component
MKLSDIVVKKAIIPSLDALSRDDAITEIVVALVAAGSIPADHQDEFIKALLKREKRGSTGFGHGVAVPHVKHPDLDGMHVAIGLSDQGIDFNALDNKPVRSIFMLLSPEDKPEDHLDAMEAIFANLSQDTFRRFLMQAETVVDVTTLIDEADANEYAN